MYLFDTIATDPQRAITAFLGVSLVLSALYFALFTAAYLAVAVPAGFMLGRMFASPAVVEPQAPSVFLVTNDKQLAGEMESLASGANMDNPFFVTSGAFTNPATWPFFQGSPIGTGFDRH